MVAYGLILSARFTSFYVLPICFAIQRQSGRKLAERTMQQQLQVAKTAAAPMSAAASSK